jgi:hypothetical protein
MDPRQSLFVFVAALCFTACREAPVAHKQPIHHHKKINAVIPTATAISTTSPVIQPDPICIAAVGDIMLGTSYPDKKPYRLMVQKIVLKTLPVSCAVPM